MSRQGRWSVFLRPVFRKAFQRTESWEMFVWCCRAVLWSWNKLWKVYLSYLMLYQFREMVMCIQSGFQTVFKPVLSHSLCVYVTQAAFILMSWCWVSVKDFIEDFVLYRRDGVQQTWLQWHPSIEIWRNDEQLNSWLLFSRASGVALQMTVLFCQSWLKSPSSYWMDFDWMWNRHL